MSSADKTKLEGQRKAVREHVLKYKKYPDERDKAFALKTIRNCQTQIAAVRKRAPQLPQSWEDTWKPGAPER